MNYMKKMGFILPVNVWFKKDLEKEFYRFLINSSIGIREYFDINYVKLLLKQHSLGKAIHGNRLWSLLMFEIWYQVVHKNKDPLSVLCFD